MAQRGWRELLRGMGCRWGLGDDGRQAVKGGSKGRGRAGRTLGGSQSYSIPKLLNGWDYG